MLQYSSNVSEAIALRPKTVNSVISAYEVYPWTKGKATFNRTSNIKAMIGRYSINSSHTYHIGSNSSKRLLPNETSEKSLYKGENLTLHVNHLSAANPVEKSRTKLISKSKHRGIEKKTIVALNTRPKKPATKYLSYKDNFSYPLDIDLESLVNDTIQGRGFNPHKPINIHPFNYLHKPGKCDFKRNPKEPINILVLVKSFIGNSESRSALRTIWADVKDSNMRRAFMLGYNRAHQLAVDNESRRYRDVIQEDFIDNYMNNTLKTIMAYNWAVRYCRRAHALLFLDDDYLVNMTVMADHIRTLYSNQSSGLYIGTLAEHAPPYRGVKERWYLTYNQYPYDEFPPYIGGGAYVVSFDVAKKFKFAFPFVQYMGIDDVYLGIVARKLSIVPRFDSHFDSKRKDTLAIECSHTASELLNNTCPLRYQKTPQTRFKRMHHKPIKAFVFFFVFGLSVVTIILLSCCLSIIVMMYANNYV